MRTVVIYFKHPVKDNPKYLENMNDLANEHMCPLRGAWIRVHNDGKTIPRITKAHWISHDESQPEQDIIYLVPKGDNILLLGGLVEPDK